MTKFRIPEHARVETLGGHTGEVISRATRKSTGDRLYSVALEPSFLFHRWYRECELKQVEQKEEK